MEDETFKQEGWHISHHDRSSQLTRAPNADAAARLRAGLNELHENLDAADTLDDAISSYRDATVRLADGRQKIWGDIHRDEQLELASLPEGGQEWQMQEIKGDQTTPGTMPCSNAAPSLCP